MIVRLPSLLDSYTGGTRQLEAEGATVGEVLAELERRYPGLRFRVIDEQDRIRTHIKIFVGDGLARSLEHPIGPGEALQIVGALSGG
ncbi:MAG: MoaD/ThiS family protein [Planctomycetota bacterium]